MKALLPAIGLAVALSPVLHAQDGLRSASLPERPIATQPPGPDDLFRAGPETYRPRPDRDRSPRDWPSVLPNGSSYWPYLNVPSPEPRRQSLRTIEPFGSGFPKHETAPVREAPDRPSTPSPPVAAPAPGGTKTMYVIPRCYAGDKPPEASIKCDLTKLRTIR